MLSKVMEVFWLQMVIRMWRTSGISESFEKKKKDGSLFLSRGIVDLSGIQFKSYAGRQAL